MIRKQYIVTLLIVACPLLFVQCFNKGLPDGDHTDQEPNDVLQDLGAQTAHKQPPQNVKTLHQLHERAPAERLDAQNARESLGEINGQTPTETEQKKALHELYREKAQEVLAQVGKHKQSQNEQDLAKQLDAQNAREINGQTPSNKKLSCLDYKNNAEKIAKKTAETLQRFKNQNGTIPPLSTIDSTDTDEDDLSDVSLPDSLQ